MSLLNSFILFLLISLSSALITPLEDEKLSGVKSEGLNFIGKQVNKFSNVAAKGKPTDMYYEDLLNYFEGIYQDIQSLASQEVINSETKSESGLKTNFLHKKDGIEAYELLASKCIHRLEFVAKWIESRQWFFLYQMDRDSLMEIRQDAYQLMIDIESITAVFIEHVLKVKKLQKKWLKIHQPKQAIKSVNDVDRNIMVIKANSMIEKIKQLIDFEKVGGKVSKEGLNFVENDLEDFKKLASQGYPVHDFYIDLKNYVKKISKDIELMLTQESIPKKKNERKCIHEIECAVKWILKRGGYVKEVSQRRLLNLIKIQLENTANEIKNQTPLLLEEENNGKRIEKSRMLSEMKEVEEMISDLIRG